MSRADINYLAGGLWITATGAILAFVAVYAICVLLLVARFSQWSAIMWLAGQLSTIVRLLPLPILVILGTLLGGDGGFSSGMWVWVFFAVHVLAKAIPLFDSEAIRLRPTISAACVGLRTTVRVRAIAAEVRFRAAEPLVGLTSAALKDTSTLAFAGVHELTERLRAVAARADLRSSSGGRWLPLALTAGLYFLICTLSARCILMLCVRPPSDRSRTAARGRLRRWSSRT